MKTGNGEFNVLALFDGHSGGQMALQRVGIKPTRYFAAEIDKFAIKVTQHNYPDTIQLGDVETIDITKLPKIHLLLAGSPCQGFSSSGKGLNFDDPRSKLFFTFVNLKEALKPDYWFLENVKMKDELSEIISRFVGIAPVEINSAKVSAQNRERYYWTNIGANSDNFFNFLTPGIQQPKDKKIFIKDILEDEVDSKYFLSEVALKGIYNHKERHKEKGNGFGAAISDGNGKSRTIQSRYYKDGSDQYVCVAVRGRNPENPNSRKKGEALKQHVCAPRTDNKSNCITSVSKDNYITNGKAIRKFTPREVAALQTVPFEYFLDIKGGGGANRVRYSNLQATRQRLDYRCYSALPILFTLKHSTK